MSETENNRSISQGLAKKISKSIMWLSIIIVVIIALMNLSKSKQSFSSWVDKKTQKTKTTEIATPSPFTPSRGSFTLIPGGKVVRISMRKVRSIDWCPETTDEYFVRYIKMDGLPWRPITSSADGWISSRNNYSPEQVMAGAGNILEVQFKVPKSKTSRWFCKVSEIPYEPVTIRISDDPTFDRNPRRYL